MRIAICILVAAAACDTSVEPAGSAGADAGLSPLCAEARDHSDLTWLQREVFTPSCASFSACHAGQALSAGG